MPQNSRGWMPLALVLAAIPCVNATPPSPTPKTIFTFTGLPDNGPSSPISIDSSGALYGTTKYGGNSAAGTVFKLSPSGGTWTQTVLHPFTGKNGDGAIPTGSLVLGPGGVIYGTTVAGGTASCGTVYEVQPPSGSGGWTETVLYNFTCGADGGQPRGGVVIGNGGVLYGAASSNGSAGCGTFFSLKPPQSGSSTWTQSVLYNFAGGSSDGCTPFSGLVFGKNQVLYGVTELGGASGNGTAFQLAPPSQGGTWTENVIWSFSGAPGDGAIPASTPVVSSTGSLYGTTSGGGASGLGTAWQLTPPSGTGGSWTETLIHSFGAASDGAGPLGLTLGQGSFVYGVTAYTGSSTKCAGGGCGTVFELKPPSGSGGNWSEVVLYNFTGVSGDGAYPSGAMAIDSKGLLYGATHQGGAGTGCGDGCGMAFEITP